MSYRDPERKKAYDRQYSKDSWVVKRTDPFYRLLSNTKHRAKAESVPFDLTADNIPRIPTTCPCCGIALKRKSDGGNWREQPSLDRVYPQRGYVVSNVVWLCRRCNQL